MNNEGLISVIVPIYKVERFLPRCLQSVVNQTYKNLEIICVNDGSPDRCGEILRKYAENDSRIKVIEQKNQGLSASRNHGLDQAHGEYVFFLDADDYIHVQALEILYNVAKKTACQIVMTEDVYRTGKDKIKNDKINQNRVRYRTMKNPLRDLYKYRLVSAVVWSKLYHRDCIGDQRFIEGIYFEDWPFTAQIFSQVNLCAIIDERIYMYNTNFPSIVRSQFSVKKIHDYIVGIRQVYEYFLQKQNQQQWDIVRKKRITASLKMILSKISKSTDNKDELEKYFKEEYKKLRRDNIINFGDLTLKSKVRLLKLFWHQRAN